MPHSDKFSFVRFTTNGKVHIYSKNTRLFPGINSPAELLMSKQTAKCGAKGKPGQQYGISEFHDNELCMACYDKVPVNERDEIFASFDNPQT